MKLRTLSITLLIFVLAGSLLACSSNDTPEPTPVAAVELPSTVSAEAYVVPIREANLSFETAGRVDQVLVEEGDAVQKGDVLIQLDDVAQQAGLARAQANLTNAQANLADVQAGARPEEIAQAQATLNKAQAALAQLLVGPTEQEIAQAQAAVNSAQARLNQVQAGPRQEDKDAAAARLLQAEAKVRLAQADYDKNVYGDPQVAEPYGVALQQATLAYDAAKAEYDALVNGPTSQEVAVTRSGVAEAQAALAKVKAGATPEQIAQTQADVAAAEAALAKVKAGATQEKIAIAEAGVQSAQADVQSAQAELSKTRLRAPFNGVIGSINVDEGEFVTTGLAIASVGDTSEWLVETDDLTEIDVVRVEVGQPVDISVDALPEANFEGKVTRIQPQSETKAGDVTYTVQIGLTNGDTSRLRWGMTTFVDIDVEADLVSR